MDGCPSHAYGRGDAGRARSIPLSTSSGPAGAQPSTSEITPPSRPAQTCSPCWRWWRLRKTSPSMRAQIAKKEAALKAEHEYVALLNSHYKVGERRRALHTERIDLAALARDFAGRAYDLDVPGRMLG